MPVSQHITEDMGIREGTTASVLDYVFTDKDRIALDLNYETPIGKSDHVCLTWNYTVFRKKTPTHIFFHISMSDV